MFLYFRTLKAAEVEAFCGDSYQCKYDYSVTLNREYGHWAKFYQSEFITLKETGLKPSTLSFQLHSIKRCVLLIFAN